MSYQIAPFNLLRISWTFSDDEISSNVFSWGGEKIPGWGEQKHTIGLKKHQTKYYLPRKKSKK